MELQDNLQPKFVPDRNLKLLDQVRQVLRYHHYSYRIEQAYCGLIVQRILSARRYAWAPCGESFLSHLATHQNVP